MNKFASMLWLGIAAFTALFLFNTKYQVQELEKQLESIHREILSDQEAIHVLKAEWSYLNRPERIADLAERHLGLTAIPPTRISRLQDIPLRQDGGVETHSGPLAASASAPASAATLTSTGETGAMPPGAKQ